ncbi:MAG: hypothetical protein ACYDGN_18190 [Acidimicrobiales bacterium]
MTASTAPATRTGNFGGDELTKTTRPEASLHREVERPKARAARPTVVEMGLPTAP